MPKLQFTEAEVDAYVDEVFEDALTDLADLISVPSVENLAEATEGAPFGPEVARALKLALAKAEKLGFATKNLEGYIGYGEISGESPEYLAVFGHNDVVPAGQGWHTDPFNMERREGFVLGRGVLDDKGPFLMSLYAAHFFRRLQDKGQTLPYSLRVMAGTNEETSMDDVAYYLQHEKQPLFLITPDADFPLVCGEKGIAQFNFTTRSALSQSAVLSLVGGQAYNAICGHAEMLVAGSASEFTPQEGLSFEAQGSSQTKVVAQGISGHASTPEGTKNALGMLARFALDQLNLDEQETKIFKLIDLVCNYESYGEKVGVAIENERFGKLTLTMGYAKILEDGRLDLGLDVRYPDATPAEELFAKLTAFGDEWDFDFAMKQNKDPFYQDPESPVIKTLLDTYAENSSDREFLADRGEVKALVIGGGTYARKFERACVYGLHEPLEPMPSWAGYEHGPDEAISEESLRRALKIYIIALGRLMNLDRESF